MSLLRLSLQQCIPISDSDSRACYYSYSHLPHRFSQVEIGLRGYRTCM
ncbi:hypothetical protein M3J09_013372 [Ascochyta lentis]